MCYSVPWYLSRSLALGAECHWSIDWMNRSRMKVFLSQILPERHLIFPIPPNSSHERSRSRRKRSSANWLKAKAQRTFNDFRIFSRRPSRSPMSQSALICPCLSFHCCKTTGLVPSSTSQTDNWIQLTQKCWRICWNLKHCWNNAKIMIRGLKSMAGMGNTWILNQSAHVGFTSKRVYDTCYNVDCPEHDHGPKDLVCSMQGVLSFSPSS